MTGDILIPYVYGAASGAPSRGRPEKVLARIRETGGEPGPLDHVPDGPPVVPGRGRPPARCGTPNGARGHYRAGEKPCGACHEAVLEYERSRRAARRPRLCPSCRQPAPDHLITCGAGL